jgi:hypothetical protein
LKDLVKRMKKSSYNEKKIYAKHTLDELVSVTPLNDKKAQ